MNVRPMTAADFAGFREVVAGLWVESQLAAGGRTADAALSEARRGFDASLPGGLSTPRHLFLTAEEDGVPVGSAWLGLDHPRGVPHCAFLNLIVVDEARRGRGLGRELLAAVEREARSRGASAIELNVFGANRPAVALYRSAGYTVITQQMRKPL